MTRKLFLAVLLLTLVALLTPGDWVLAAKQWVVSWLPFGRALDPRVRHQNAIFR